MKIYKKEHLLKVISENANLELSEMPKKPVERSFSSQFYRSGLEQKLEKKTGDSKAGSDILPTETAIKYKYSGPIVAAPRATQGKTIGTLNPETQEVENGVIYGQTIRISPNGRAKFLVFKPYLDGKPVMSGTVHVQWWIDITLVPGRIFGHVPRKEWVEKFPEYFENAELDYDPAEPMSDREKAKRGVWYPTINEFFNSKQLLKPLASFGFPKIIAAKVYDKPITDKEEWEKFSDGSTRKIDYVGANIAFKFHSVRDENDIQGALDKVFNAIFQIEQEEEPDPYVSDVKHHPRYYKKRYYNGSWTDTLRTYSKDYHSLTDKYELNRRAVQKGEIEISLTSILEVIGVFGDDNAYHLNVTFLVYRNLRNLNTGGNDRTPVINPIKVRVDTRLINSIYDTVIDKKDVYVDLLNSALIQIENKLYDLNPAEVMGRLIPDPNEVMPM